MHHPVSYSQVISNNYLRCRAVAQFVALKIRYEHLWPAIVFVRRTSHAARLADQISIELEKIPGEITPRAVALTAAVPLRTREHIAACMSKRDPQYPVVVATDVWSQGIDIPVLRAVFIAGQGQAPIGGAQRPGRGVRAATGKPNYVIFDIHDIGVPRYEKQQALRMRHYTEAGFAVERSPQPPREQTAHDLDILFDQPAIRAIRAHERRELQQQECRSKLKLWVLHELFDLTGHRLIICAFIVLMILMGLIGKCGELVLPQ